MKFILYVFLITTTLVALGKTSKILMVCPSSSHSHYILAFKLARELAHRGHEITFINPYPQEKPIKNLKEISVAEVLAGQIDRRKGLIEFGKLSYIDGLYQSAEYGWNHTENTLKVKEVQELLKSNDKFDLVILTHTLNEALLIFSYKFNCPSIILEPLSTTMLSNFFFANPSPPSYIPNIFSNFGTHMTFWKRLRNVYYEVIGELFINYVTIPGHDAILKRVVPGAPHLQNLMYNSSLMLLTSHVGCNAPYPLQPAIKEIGGFHIEPTSPLPADLQVFLDDAKEGVIYFSMGSNVKSANIDQDGKDAILNIFSKLRQKVLWKFETDLPRKPKNVKINKWFPQQDIFAHPNLLVFISHGGLLSVMEAVHHGVPLLCMPVYWDQMGNCENAESLGFALTVSLHEFNGELFELALNELINNTKYRENAKMRSKILHDRPMKPMDEAVFWIEYVIRHKGAPHLRSAGLDLKWYQRHLVDIMLFLSFISLACLITLFYLIRYICDKIRETKVKKE